MAKALRKRLSRHESQVITRGKLLDSARMLIGKFGIDGTSIEQVAESAGYSRGAFYSNFENKDDLICAVLQRELDLKSDELASIFSEPMTPVRLTAVRDYYIKFSSDPNGCMFLVAMQMHAMQNPGVRGRISTLLRADRERMVAMTRKAAKQLEQQGSPLCASAETIVLSLASQAMGLCMTWMLDKESITVRQVRQALKNSFEHLTKVNA